MLQVYLINILICSKGIKDLDIFRFNQANQTETKESTFNLYKDKLSKKRVKKQHGESL